MDLLAFHKSIASGRNLRIPLPLCTTFEAQQLCHADVSVFQHVPCEKNTSLCI